MGWASSSSSRFETPTFMWDYTNDHNRQRGLLIDLNGDDLPDWVTAFDDGDSPMRATRLNNGSGFGPLDASWKLPVSLWAFGGGDNHTEATLVDLNADGLPDLLQATTDNENRDHKGVWLNTGSGTKAPSRAGLHRRRSGTTPRDRPHPTRRRCDRRPSWPT